MQAVKKFFTLFTMFSMLLTIGLAPAWAQNIVSGEIDGLVSDPSGAVLPNATVTLKSVASGETQTTTTGPSGTYRFPLLRPGDYQFRWRPAALIPRHAP